ncbi:hypothetical protein AH156_19735 [Salmonella enterica subsp. enterica serovar Enteritidis]|nr:hypothetical protein [Salmonella enterica subsp. enterica serovar Enteritidis]
MATTANANPDGTLTGHFTIPAGIRAGTKQFMVLGDASNPKQQSNAETTFTGQGTVVTNTMRQVKNVMQSYYDPLAQTFMLNEARQLTGIRVWVVAKGTTPLIVQLRETSVGFPTRTIIAEGHLDATDPAYKVGQWVQVMFDKPFYASANIEYAVVVLANDADTTVGISELGKKDLNQQGQPYVSSQPYQVGVLLSSANASTWTAHQDKDLTFQLLASRYTGQPKQVILGEITIPAGTTDLLISAMTNTPATLADADLLLRIYDDQGNKVETERSVSDGQVVKFQDAYGKARKVEVRANLRCTTTASATIEPGTQIIAGIMESNGDYISRNIPADDGKDSDVTVTLEASPTTSAVKVAIGVVPTAGVIQNWIDLPQITRPANHSDVLANGNIVFTFKSTAKITAAANLKVKVSLSGSAGARPTVYNLRVSVV